MCMCKLLPVHYNMYRCLCKSVKITLFYHVTCRHCGLGFEWFKVLSYLGQFYWNNNLEKCLVTFPFIIMKLQT